MKNKAWLLAIFAVSLALRLHGLGERSLWTDEFFTLFQATGHGIDAQRYVDRVRGAGQPTFVAAGQLKSYLHRDDAKNAVDVVRGVLRTDDHPPLYFVLIHFWMKAWGDGAPAVRLFSVLAGMLSVAVAYALARRLFDERAALATALFAGLSPFSVRFSQEARSYAFILFLGLVSWWVVLRLQRSPRLVDIVLLALVNACGLMTHYFFGFFIAAQFCFMTALYRSDKRRLDAFYLSLILGILFFMPWAWKLLLQQYNYEHAAWIVGFPGVLDKLSFFCAGPGRFLALFDTLAPSRSGLLLFLPALAWVSLVVLGFGDCLRRYRHSCIMCLVMLGVPLAGMLFVDIAQHGVLLRQERFWMFVFAGALPLTGYALVSLYERWKPLAISLVAALAAASWMACGVQFGPAPRTSSHWLRSAVSGKPAAVLVFNLRSVLFAQAYYMPDGTAVVPVSDEEQFRKAWAQAGKSAGMIFVVNHRHPSGPLLTDNGFMAEKSRFGDCCLTGSFNRDNVYISEYAPCAS